MNRPRPKAPELRVPYWIDADGEERGPLTLSELGLGYKIIFCFKAECPGCHSGGFPIMKKLVDNLQDKDFGFAVIHTAFDDDPRNSPDRIREMQIKYDLKVPFGHDPKNGIYPPTFMQDYGTRGTPFFIVIDPNGYVAFGDFSLDAGKLIQSFS